MGAHAWVRRRGACGRFCPAHALLVPIARSAAWRRGAARRIEGPELHDLAHQAAADALLAIAGKLAEFRGESRFTTWAQARDLRAVGKARWTLLAQVRRVIRREDWDRPLDRRALDSERDSEWHEFVLALRGAVDDDLGERQGAMFDARRKLRTFVAGGHIELETGRRPKHLEEFQRTDPLNAGCGRTMELLDVCVESSRWPMPSPSGPSRTSLCIYADVGHARGACG